VLSQRTLEMLREYFSAYRPTPAKPEKLLYNGFPA
jgi:hypothetical protein